MSATEHVTLELTVNGERQRRVVRARMNLADFLRDELQLTGTKLGCEHGACGACSVLLDGRAVRSCLILAAQANGAEVTTIEGLSDGSTLSDLQLSFREHHALQCGFCTPGFLVTATDVLQANPSATEADIRDALAGNICRCTGYEPIVDAVLAVARTRSEAAS